MEMEEEEKLKAVREGGGGRLFIRTAARARRRTASPPDQPSTTRLACRQDQANHARGSRPRLLWSRAPDRGKRRYAPAIPYRTAGRAAARPRSQLIKQIIRRRYGIEILPPSRTSDQPSFLAGAIRSPPSLPSDFRLPFPLSSSSISSATPRPTLHPRFSRLYSTASI